MENQDYWKNQCKQLFNRRKNQEMSRLGKILDIFCKEVWSCTLYPGGVAMGDPELYELYRGYEIEENNFIRIINQEEILKDPDFQDWYYKMAEKQKQRNQK